MIKNSAVSSHPQPLGIVVFDGASRINRQRIIAVVTGFGGTDNQKTGQLLQSWILPADVPPLVAIDSGADRSVCGNCPMRGKIENGRNRHRSCYVSIRNAPRAVYDAWTRGRYDIFDPSRHLDLSRDRLLRLGSFGEAAAVPVRAWQPILDTVGGSTGYSHLWKFSKFAPMRRWCMASVHTPQEAQEARQRGWRYFRTAQPGSALLPGEFRCPAAKESGHRLQCADCMACDGCGRNPNRASAVIETHGSPAVLSSYSRNVPQC